MQTSVFTMLYKGFCDSQGLRICERPYKIIKYSLQGFMRGLLISVFKGMYRNLIYHWDITVFARLYKGFAIFGHAEMYPKPYNL